jgi:hypothetical protein
VNWIESEWWKRGGCSVLVLGYKGITTKNGVIEDGDVAAMMML